MDKKKDTHSLREILKMTQEKHIAYVLISKFADFLPYAYAGHNLSGVS